MAALTRAYRHYMAKLTGLNKSRTLILNLCKKLLFCVGFWPADRKPKGIVAIVRKLLPPFLLFTNSYAGLIGYPMRSFTSAGGDLQRCVRAAACIFVDLTLFTTYTSLLFRREQIGRVFRAMEAINACSAKLAERPLDIVERNARWSKWPLGYLVVCLGPLPLAFFDAPALYAKREFVYDQWYPFDEKASPTYQAVFVLTFISHTGAAICFVSFAAMFMSLLVEAIGHFRLLSHNLRHVLDVHPLDGGTRTGGLPAREPVANGRSTEGRHPHVDNGLTSARQKQLEACVDQHCALLRYVHDVTCLFNRFLFSFLILALVPTSMAIVLLIYAKEFDAMVMTTYIMVAGSNAASIVMCWLADKITEESEGVRDAVFDCDWFGQPDSFKRSMRIIISRCNQPVIVKVDGFVALSMETYYAMSKLIYSYCMAMWTQYKKISTRQTEVV